MSWYDGLADLLPTVVSVGSQIYTNNQKQEANKAATAAQQAGLLRQEQIEQQNQNIGSQGTASLEQQVQRGAAITPAQQIALDNARRDTLNALSVGGLQGSGRATVAAVNNVDSNMRTNFMQGNQNTANQAASGLSGQYFNAGTALGNNAINQGDKQSNQIIGNTGLGTSSLNDISGAIADYTKNQNASQYSINRSQNPATQTSEPSVNPQLSTPSSYETGDGYNYNNNDDQQL